MNKEDRKDLVERLRNTPTERTWDSVGRPYDYPKHLPLEAADEIYRLRRELEEARKALETAKTQIIAAYRVWVADDVTAFPTPMSQAGEAIAKIDAALRAEEGGK